MGIELRYDAPSERVCVAGIAADSPAISPATSPAKGRSAQGGLKVGKVGDLGGVGLKVGDVLLAIDGVRAVDVQTAAEVLRMAAGRVEVRVQRCDGYGGDCG